MEHRGLVSLYRESDGNERDRYFSAKLKGEITLSDRDHSKIDYALMIRAKIINQSIKNRIKMKKIAAAALLSLLTVGQAYSQTSKVTNTKNMSQVEDKELFTFPLSDRVTRQKVTFKNRFGITLSGDLYLPKNPGTPKLAALAISGPFGAVKEQSSGLYANTMAERGFVALAFDPSYTGESGGEPRHVASPDINTEDFSAAVDYLGLHKSVDRNRIGIIGICGWAGFSLNAAAVDKRIKAVATTSMYDMSRVNAKGYYDKLSTEARTKMLEQLGEQRWKDAENGEVSIGTRNLPEKLTGDEPQFVKEYFDYYRTSRGFHPRSLNSNSGWTTTNALSFMNTPLLTYIKEIAPRPVLLIAGENAHSRYFSEDAYKAAAEPKELVIIPNAVHVDLYDKLDVIPFDKLTAFFSQHLNQERGNKKATVNETPSAGTNVSNK